MAGATGGAIGYGLTTINPHCQTTINMDQFAGATALGATVASLIPSSAYPLILEILRRKNINLPVTEQAVKFFALGFAWMATTGALSSELGTLMLQIEDNTPRSNFSIPIAGEVGQGIAICSVMLGMGLAGMLLNSAMRENKIRQAELPKPRAGV